MDRLLNTKEMMQALNCGKTKLYEMLENDVLPTTKIGNRYYISEKKLDNWIANSVERSY